MARAEWTKAATRQTTQASAVKHAAAKELRRTKAQDSPVDGRAEPRAGAGACERSLETAYRGSGRDAAINGAVDAEAEADGAPTKKRTAFGFWLGFLAPVPPALRDNAGLAHAHREAHYRFCSLSWTGLLRLCPGFVDPLSCSSLLAFSLSSLPWLLVQLPVHPPPLRPPPSPPPPKPPPHLPFFSAVLRFPCESKGRACEKM